MANDIDNERFLSWGNSYRNEDTINSRIVDVKAEGRRRHRQHIHIAGYYNIEGFWDRKLKKVLNSVRAMRSETNSSNPGGVEYGSIPWDNFYFTDSAH
mmetsp:Transcript_22792/g.27881  ORF Transcript_22792/g.27881 Transcript_22792/m.27881 type:complete len:98 (-) Transcript_22792:421-714(-)